MADRDLPRRGTRRAAAGDATSFERLAVLHATLLDATRRIAGAGAPARLLAETCQALVEHGAFSMAWIGTVSADRSRIVPLAQAGDERGYLEELEISPADVPLGRGPTGTAVRTGEASISTDVATDPRMLPWRDRLLERAYRSSSAFPLRSRAEPTAVLTVYADTTGAFGPAEVELLDDLARSVGFALDALRERDARVEAERRAHGTERLVAETLGHIGEAFVVLDADGRCSYANGQAAELTGRSPDALVGMTIPQMVPGSVGAALEGARRQVVRTAKPTAIELGDDTAARRYEARLFPSGTGVAIFARDVTEQRRLETRARRATERLEALHAMDLAILAARAPREIAAAALAGLAQLAPGGRVSIIHFDPARDRVEILASNGSLPFDRAGEGPLSDFAPIPALLAAGVPIAIDLDALTDLGPAAEALRAAGTHLLLGVPMLSETGTVIGSVNVGTAAPGELAADAPAAVSAVAAVLAIALRQADLRAEEQAARASAAESERRIAELLGRVTDGFVAWDADWRYTYVNERGAALLGRRPEDLIGRLYHAEFPEAIGGPFEQAYARAMREQVPIVLEDYYAPWDRWFENRIFPTGEGIAILFTEISERKRAEAELRRAAARLAALHEMDLGILASRDAREICGVALEHLERLVPNDRSVVGLVNPASASGQVLAARGDDPTGPAQGDRLVAADFPAHFEVVRRGVPAVLDLAASGGSARADAYLAAGFRTMLVTPLISGRLSPIGFIGLARRSAAGFSQDEIAVAGEIASQVTVALHTQTLREEQQMAEFERDRLAAALEQSPEAVMLTDLRGAIEYVNPAFERLTGYAREEAIGQNPRILQSGRQSPEFYAELWRTLVAGGVWAGDLVDRRKDGTLYTTAAVLSPIRDAAGVTTGYVGVQRDVTAERQLETREMRHARERSLVAAALRTLRAQDSPEETAAAICTQVVQLPEVQSATLLRFELDGGAMPLAIVTADGRAVDRVRVTPERNAEMRTRAAQGPWVEEWRPRRGHPYRAFHVALGLRAQAYAPMYAGSDLVGILTVGSADPDAVALLTERLPALLEFATLAGAVLAPALSLQAAAGEARGRISRVIETRAFHPVFQPIVDLETRRTVGYEALTRFDDGMRPDLRFDEAASGARGLEREPATLEAAGAAAAGLVPEAWLDCNVSPALLLEPARLRRALDPVLAPGARRVVVEITEHEPIHDYRAIRRSLTRLGPAVELAVDDAGAGFASFRHILELRPRYVKLDYGLVHRIDHDPARQALIVGMVHFAGQVGCQLIAEGVETAAERRTLRSLGIRLGQGYLLGRPEPMAPSRP